MYFDHDAIEFVFENFTDAKECSMAEHALLLAIAYRENPNNYYCCWPSNKGLRKLTCIKDETTVNKARDQLIQRGLIRLIDQNEFLKLGTQYNGESNVYELTCYKNFINGNLEIPKKIPAKNKNVTPKNRGTLPEKSGYPPPKNRGRTTKEQIKEQTTEQEDVVVDMSNAYQAFIYSKFKQYMDRDLNERESKTLSGIIRHRIVKDVFQKFDELMYQGMSSVKNPFAYLVSTLSSIPEQKEVAKTNYINEESPTFQEFLAFHQDFQKDKSK